MTLTEVVSEDALVLDAVGSKRRPFTRLEGVLAQGDLLFRVIVGNAVQLWVWIDDWWEDYVFVRPRVATWTPLIPPIDADRVRNAQWLWFMREQLEASPRSPIYAARFRLELATAERNRVWPAGEQVPLGMPTRPSTETIALCRASFWNEDWYAEPKQVPGSLLPLRNLSASDAGRLKWWRKVARAGALPPVLTWYVQVLDKYAVLDGHVRLQAALAEGVDVPLVRLWHADSTPPQPKPKREALERGVAQLLAATPSAVPEANTMLRLAYEGRTFAKQRGWPVPGGAKAWFTSMRASLPPLETLPDWVPDWLTTLERKAAGA